ncbi:MAG TPA: hypothetical protein PKB06_07130, partial [Actinotalea sp.]|nr:hypothetical protein [Actinotalea sp.]
MRPIWVAMRFEDSILLGGWSGLMNELLVHGGFCDPAGFTPSVLGASASAATLVGPSPDVLVAGLAGTSLSGSRLVLFRLGRTPAPPAWPYRPVGDVQRSTTPPVEAPPDPRPTGPWVVAGPAAARDPGAADPGPWQAPSSAPAPATEWSTDSWGRAVRTRKARRSRTGWLVVPAILLALVGGSLAAASGRH